MAGRPTDCTPEVTALVVDNITAGLSNRDAAALAGVSESAFYEWLARGREELERRDNPRVKPGSQQWDREQPFVEFAEAVKRAIPNRKRKHLDNINKASSEGTWQASAWLLERLHFEEFGRRDKLDVVARHVDMTAEDLKQAEDELERWRRGRDAGNDEAD